MLHVLLPVIKVLSNENLFIISELQHNEMNSIKETGLTKQQSYYLCVSQYYTGSVFYLPNTDVTSCLSLIERTIPHTGLLTSPS
jgi:hypothetical protein